MTRLTRRSFVSTLVGTAGLAAVDPVLVLAKTADGFFDLTAKQSAIHLVGKDGPSSTLWAYNNTSPGPQIRVRQGERVRVRFHNNLTEATSIHWHGIRIDNAMDGVSGLTQEPVQPGDSFDYDFVVPDAGTYWYHAHNKSWNQVARGLYGSLIVEEPAEVFDRDHDLTLVLDDWRLQQDGTFDTASLGSMMDWSHGGRVGNWPTTNGERLPNFVLRTGEAYRLRLINAANARIFEIDPNRFNARILAWDGQAVPLPHKLPYQPLLLGPAQRVDLLVIPKKPGEFALEEISGPKPWPTAVFRVIAGNSGTAQETPILPVNSLPDPDLDKSITVPLKMTGGAMRRMGPTTYKGQPLDGENYQRTRQFWAFNGVANLGEDPLFRAQIGQTMQVEISNATAFPHAMHVHGHHFRVVARDGNKINDGSPWRDTVMVGAEQSVTIAFVADNPGKWLLHCHMLEHAAAGMNTWFEVA
ncbi:MAG: multicopper oxidase family protein [Cohaesibacteraceae bacterium]|nr:multicopper oxidase family protein [Cohaesibacteraceae bacterium]